MHATEMVDLAALVVLNNQMIIKDNVRLVDDAVHSYWSSSRCRLDRWGRGLRTGLTERSCSRALVEEIVVSEILARTTAALFVAHDQYHHRQEVGPVGRNILYGHIDARRRAMSRLSGSDDGQNHTKELHRLCSRAARWNDLLLGYLLPFGAVEEFAFDANRAREFSYDVDQFAVDPETGDMSANLLRSTLRMALRPLDGKFEYSSELNAQIAASVIGCFGPELFDSFGLLKSTWHHRMEQVADDTMDMIGRLVD